MLEAHNCLRINTLPINNLNLTLPSVCSLSPAFEYLLPIAEQIGVILIFFSKSHFSNSHLLLKINVLVWLKFKNFLRLLVLNVIFWFSLKASLFPFYRCIERSAIIGFHQFDSPFQHFCRNLFSERIFAERIGRIITERISRIISERVVLSTHL